MSRCLPAVALLLVTACASQGPGPGDLPTGGAQLQGRTFLSTSMTGHELVAGTRIMLDFPELGKLTVSAGCNHLFGDVSFAADTLAVSGMGGTEMGCERALHEQDEWLTAFLSAGPKWALTGNELVLTGENAEIKLLDREVADPDRPLAGRWVVESLLDGESVSSVPAGAEAWLEFEDGKVFGDTGCNSLSGSYVHSGESITFAQIATTKKACLGDAGVLEAAVLAVVNGEVTMNIEADVLKLSHLSGQGLLLRSATEPRPKGTK